MVAPPNNGKVLFDLSPVCTIHEKKDQEYLREVVDPDQVNGLPKEFSIGTVKKRCLIVSSLQQNTYDLFPLQFFLAKFCLVKITPL